MTDSTPAVLTELAAALAPLPGLILGLQDLQGADVSPALQAELVAQTNALTNLQALMEAARTAIENLQAAGYPNMPANIPLPTSLWYELQQVQAATNAAFALLTPPS
jgi:hypothetical protein